MSFEWSPQQMSAIAKVNAWYKAGNDQVFYLAGYAGTGKTTVSHHLVEEAGAVPCYAAYTGKAAQVMRQSGCAGAGTLHSKIYKFKRNQNTGKITKRVNRTKKTSPILASDIIVVDECSMVDEEVGKDLASFDKPILVLGDPMQLPPVKGGGYFTSGEPNMMLTDIHRQAEGNPIIKLATDVRNGIGLDYGQFGESSVLTKAQFREQKNILDADQVLVGYRHTRTQFNNRIRELKGRLGAMPVMGDRVICRRNDKNLSIFNGQLFDVTGTHDATFEHPKMLGLSVRPEDDPEGESLDVLVRSEFITGDKQPHWRELKGTQQFEYGYVLTVHLSQGSQWNHVVLFDEAFGSPEDRVRWLYTGITRAAQSITIVR